MTSGGNNFNYFPENQLTKFSAVLQFKHSVPPNFLILNIFIPPRISVTVLQFKHSVPPNFLILNIFIPPRISVTHFAPPGMPLDAPEDYGKYWENHFLSHDQAIRCSQQVGLLVTSYCPVFDLKFSVKTSRSVTFQFLVIEIESSFKDKTHTISLQQ